MFRSLALALALGSLALPAVAATSIKISVAGLDAPSAHAAIVRAAKTACQVELRESSTFEQHYHWLDCVDGAVARAQANLDTQSASAAPAPTRSGR